MRTLRGVWVASGLLSLAPLAAQAEETSVGSFNFTWNGYIRSETAFRDYPDSNPYNQVGNQFNGVTVTRNGLAGTDTATRNGSSVNNLLNMQLFRVELDSVMKFTSNLSLQAKLRGVVDPGAYDEFKPGDVSSQAVGQLYGKPDYFTYDVQGMSHPQPLEWTGRNYQVYFPALFLEYNRGPLNVRLGNQQIAWGQAIFFRVLDVVDGLDLRRHSALDFASEEFSDKRVPALALRTTYQISDGWLADAFVQKFQPSVVPNPNTPYNVIPSQFTIHDGYADYKSRVDYGIRIKGNIGDLGLQAIAVRRYNPDGLYHWAASNVDRDLPGAPGTGAILAQTPFEVDPTGVWSSREWFNYAAATRLNGVDALSASVNFSPAAALLGAFPITSANCAAFLPSGAANTASNSHSADAYNCAAKELNQFFQASGSGLRGHLRRDYALESNYGGGASYVITSTPGSILDQLIINVEATYTPNRPFTNPSLAGDFVVKNEWTTALVMEKYQRFSASFPATYMVFQWMHKTQSDLFGRYIGGMGGDINTIAPGYKNGWNGLALGLQQPLPNLIWRFDLSALYDPHGGILVQPAVRWKPNGKVTVEGFYNYLNGSFGGNRNSNIVSTIDFAREFTLRVGYQF
jgi:hypothetical protein